MPAPRARPARTSRRCPPAAHEPRVARAARSPPRARPRALPPPRRGRRDASPEASAALLPPPARRPPALLAPPPRCGRSAAGGRAGPEAARAAYADLARAPAPRRRPPVTGPGAPAWNRPPPSCFRGPSPISPSTCALSMGFAPWARRGSSGYSGRNGSGAGVEPTRRAGTRARDDALRALASLAAEIDPDRRWEDLVEAARDDAPGDAEDLLSRCRDAAGEASARRSTPASSPFPSPRATPP